VLVYTAINICKEKQGINRQTLLLRPVTVINNLVN